MMIAKDIKIDEDLPNFFHALALQPSNEAVLEYLNVKKNYGFEFEDP